MSRLRALAHWRVFPPPPVHFLCNAVRPRYDLDRRVGPHDDKKTISLEIFNLDLQKIPHKNRGLVGGLFV